MKQRHLLILAASLSTIGILLFIYKSVFLGFPLLASSKSDLWQVEVKLTISAGNVPVKAMLAIPRTSARFVVVNENFVSRGFGLTTRFSKGTRIATWSKRHARGRHTFYYRAAIRPIVPKVDKPVSPPAPDIPEYNEVQQQAADTLFRQLREQSADTDSLIRNLLKLCKYDFADENLRLLIPSGLSLEKTLDAISRFLNYASIPSQSVHGILLTESSDEVKVHHWLEVYDSGWKSYDFVTLDYLSDDYFAWWRGDHELVQLKGAKLLHVSFSVSHTEEIALKSALLAGVQKIPLWQSFSLFGLPLDTQHVYQIILMIPVGALLLVILRNMVGIKTFGTFMPILIALAFRETQLLWGIVLFIIIVSIGLSIRFYLDNLKLLLVPRLAAVLTIVILLMLLISVISNKMGIERGLSVALFPMVILSMTIERMSIVWEERGPAEAIQQGLGSILVAALAYLLMTNGYLQHLIFTFPELLLVILSIILLLGRYSGYRLLELYRFKAFYKNV